MEKDYLKKFIDLGGSEFLAYDQFSVPEGDRETLRAPFEGAADAELDVSEQLDATGYGPTPAEGADDELDDTIEADEIPEHEGLVAAYFREMLRYSILSPEEERGLGRIIKEGQDQILNVVSVASPIWRKSVISRRSSSIGSRPRTRAPKGRKSSSR